MQRKKITPWTWIPTLYFAEGIPYVIVMTLSVIFYKRMGISNTDIALYTSWLYLPWVIKPLWSPFVDLLKTKRWWIVAMQLLIGGGLAGVAFTIPLPSFFQYTLAFFWLLAFSSATHDIAVDGFYLLGLTKKEQSYYIGIRSTFYRLAMLTGQGLIVILAGYLEASDGLPVNKITVSAVNKELKNDISTQRATPQDTSKMYFITDSSVLISTLPANADSTAKLLKRVDSINVVNGFYVGEQSNSARERGVGWWQRGVSEPLAQWLTAIFRNNREITYSGLTGSVAVTSFYLSKKPEHNRPVILVISRQKGDKSIRLAKSYRFEFNETNWDKPAYVAFRTDAGQTGNEVTVFSTRSGNLSFAWSIVFGIMAVAFLLFFMYHKFVLPYPTDDTSNTVDSGRGVEIRQFLDVFKEFFRKRDIGVMITFLLIYRLGESQLVKIAAPFLLDTRDVNGLGLTTSDIGFLYGTVGIIALSAGGIIGGVVVAKRGLRHWLWRMTVAMNLPNLVYVYLSYAMPSSLWVIGLSVAVEQFGYGFGFTAYMLYMIHIAEGKYKTAHFAITTGFMALGMMIPGMISGWLQEAIGYHNFFIWVMICTIPAFVMVPVVRKSLSRAEG